MQNCKIQSISCFDSFGAQMLQSYDSFLLIVHLKSMKCLCLTVKHEVMWDYHKTGVYVQTLQNKPEYLLFIQK